MHVPTMNVKHVEETYIMNYSCTYFRFYTC